MNSVYPPSHFYSGSAGGPGAGPGGGIPGGGGSVPGGGGSVPGGGGIPSGFPGGPRPAIGPQSPHLGPGKMAPLGGMNMNQANMMNSRLGGGGAADDSEPKVCAGCGVRIVEKTLLHSMERYWHEACLRCSCCGVNLADSASCFMKSGMILCKADYAR